MAANVTFDPITKIMYVTTVPVSGVEVSDPTGFYVDLDVKVDFYSDAKEDWLSDPYLNQFLFPMRSVGGDPLPGDKSLGDTFFLRYGWKIQPYPSTHTFRINGNLYSEDGSSPFVAPPTGSVTIINTVSSLVDSTLAQLPQIEYASFQNGVWIDAINGTTGIDFPNGTPEQPVNNAIDAVAIANYRGFDKLFVIGNYTFTTGDNIDGFTIEGQNAGKSWIQVDDGASCVGCEFQECYLTGILDGGSIVRNSIIADLNYVNGVIFNTMLNPGTIVLGGDTTAHFLDCFSGVPGTGTPTIDFNNGANSLGMRSYAGGIKLINKSQGDAVSIDLESGQVILDTTCTSGDIVIRGVGTLTDNSSGANVLADDLMNKANISSAVYEQVGTEIQFASYRNGVTIDQTDGGAGTTYPYGTQSSPVSGWDDAHAIADNLGFDTFYIIGDATVPSGTNVNGHIIIGQGASPGVSRTTITLEDGCTTSNTEFQFCRIEGYQGGECDFISCTIGELFDSHCTFEDCYLIGPLHQYAATGFDWTPNHTTTHRNSVTSTDWFVVDHNGTGLQQNYTGFSGKIKFTNVTNSNAVININMDAGEVWIDSSCTGGTITIQGTGNLTDESNGTTVNASNLMNKLNISESVWERTSGIQRLIESQKRVPMFGEMFYVDYTLGLSGNDGITPETPVHSVQFAHDNLVVDGRGDMIFLINSGASLNIDEQWNFTKHHFAVRADGWDTTLLPTVTAGASITIDADEVALEGFQVRCSATEGTSADQYCIKLASGSDNCSLKNLKIKYSHEGGLEIEDSDGLYVSDCVIEHHSGTAGIHLRGDSHECVFENNFIYDMSMGVMVHDTARENWIKNNLFHDMGKGVMVMDDTVGHLYIDRNNTFANMGRELDNDVGASGVHFARFDDYEHQADYTWNEQLSGHTDVGSAGYSLANIAAGANPSDIANAVWTHTTGKSLTADVQFVKYIEGGRWSIDGTQMVFYATDNTTEIARFDLKDEFGQPNAEAVFHRFRV